MHRPNIDACSLLYDRDCWQAYLKHFIQPAPEYLRVFASALCSFFNVSKDTYLSHLSINPEAAIDHLIANYSKSLLEIWAERRDHGVRGEFLMGSMGRLQTGETVNERVLATARDLPGVTVWINVPLTSHAAALRTIEEGISRGARGANIIPFLDQTSLNDPHTFPIFGILSEAKMPVWIHTGHHFASTAVSGIDSWRLIDEIARRFPQLIIVMGHAGWPQVRESTLIAARHQNVYLEFSTHRAHSLATEPEWFALRQARRGRIRKRILFGTSTWVNPKPIQELVSELDELGLPDEIIADWIFNNANHIMNITS